MQKLVILLSCLVCLAAAGHLERKPWWWQNVVGHQQKETTKLEIPEDEIRGRQKFLLDVLLQLQNPLVNREFIDLGKVLINDPAAYREPQDELLWEFLERCREHEMLGRNDIYTETDIEHVRQLVGLAKFLTLAKDWPTFMRNVCFARLHMNPIMFFNALLMAVHEREDTNMLVMPSMHEVLPQLFYDKDVILTAENVEWLDLMKTTTTKPNLMNIIGLGNVLNMISPIHWIRMGKAGLWRPWHEHHLSPAEAKKMVVEMKEPMSENMIVGQMGGATIGPIGVTWRTQLDTPVTPVAENKIDDTKIVVQTDEKLVIPVEQENWISYLTDDVGLNIFWNHAINQRLVETVTGDQHHKLLKTMPWQKQWKNHGKWNRVEGRDEENRNSEWSEWRPIECLKQGNKCKWGRVGGMEEEKRHTEWQPKMTKAEKEQWRHEKFIANERDENTKHGWTKPGWKQNDNVSEVKRVGQKWRMPEEDNFEERVHGSNFEEPEHKRLLHVNRRRQNWQRSDWWQKRQNVPEMSERTEKRWNSHVPVVDDEEKHQRTRSHWSNIHNGRIVDEEVMPWNTDRLDSQHADDWKSGKQGPNRGNWLKPESKDDWSLWQQRNQKITEEMTHPQGRTQGHWFESDSDKVNNNRADEIVWRKHAGIHGDQDDDEERLNKRNGWAAGIDKKQWQSRDQPWRRNEVEGKNWWQQEQRNVNEADDDDWKMSRTNKHADDDWMKSQRSERVPLWRRKDVDDKDEVVGDKDWQKLWQDRRIVDGDRLMSRTNKDDDDWMKSQRSERVPLWRRKDVDDKDEVVGDKDWQKSWQDRRIVDGDRLMSRTNKVDDDWMKSQRSERVPLWRRKDVDDKDEVVGDKDWQKSWQDRRINDEDRLRSRSTKDDDDWMKSQRTKNVPLLRRTNVDDKDDVVDDQDWQKSWQDRRINDEDRLMSRTTKDDDDWINSQRRPVVDDRADVEVGKNWQNRRTIDDDDRWMSRTTNDDDWDTPQHERDDDRETRHSRTTRSIKTIENSHAQELMNARSGEMFIQNMQQLMARINMEKISLAQSMETKPMAEHVWRKPQLMTTKGKLYEQIMVTPAEAHIKIEKNIMKLKQIIDSELEHIQMRPNHPEIVKKIGEILVDANGELGNVWDELYNDINKAVYGLESPSSQITFLSMPSTNLREPIYQDILTSLNELIWHYKQQLQPYKREQLLVPGIHVDHVEVDDLVTYFDVSDEDILNLVDQQLLQINLQKVERQLVARQHRLNHKQFTLGYDITAEQPQRVVVRTFLGPKVDENGRPMPLEVARQHYMLLDAFVQNLMPGGNHIERNSREIVWTTRDTTSLSEMYRRVVQGLPMHELVGANCRYPHRLLLPRGTPSGLAMQLIVVVTPVSEEDRVLQELVDPELLCGLGIAAMHLDTLPLDFPLDRTIENVVEFLQPNMLMKDVWIKHDESVEVPRV